MNSVTAHRVRYATFALLSILIAAPGVHAFELVLDHTTAVWLSHGLALLGLALTIWRWRATRPTTIA